MAILTLLATYGLRAGEITALRLDDIDWRREQLRVRHSKTGHETWLPLVGPVGEALVDYLQKGRPKVSAREIFIRVRAPYRPLHNGSRRALATQRSAIPFCHGLRTPVRIGLMLLAFRKARTSLPNLAS
jgi:integrase